MSGSNQGTKSFQEESRSMNQHNFSSVPVLTTTASAKKNENKLSILQINLHHSKDASALLVKTIEDKEADIIMIQEPYATGTDTVELKNIPEGYVAHHRLDREHSYGAAILVKDSMQSTIISSCSRNHIACVKLFIGSFVFLLISAYWRPTVASISDAIQEILQQNIELKERTIICMDANARSTSWNSTRTDERGMELEQLALRYSLTIANVRKENLSFVPPRTSFIDVTLVGPELIVDGWRFLDDHSLSDHPYIFMQCHHNNQRDTSTTGPRKLKVPRVSQLDKVVFKAQLSHQLECATLGSAPTTLEETEVYAEKLTNAIVTAATKSKVKFRKGSKCLSPWWTAELSDQRERVRHAYRRCGVVNSEATRSDLREEKKKYQRAVRWARAKSFRDFCTDNMNEKLHTALNQIAGGGEKESGPSELRLNGKIETEPTVIMEALASCFFPEEGSSSEQHTETIEAAAHYCNTEESTEDSQQPPEITSIELRKAISTVRRNAAPGADGITVPLLLLALQFIEPHLLLLFNACLSFGIFPRSWKMARVTVIRKPGKSNYLDAGNFRPISVLPSMGKVFEKVIQNRLNWFAEQGSWFSENQHGFRRGRSTETALHTLVSDIEESFGERAITASLFIDIWNAFILAWASGIVAALGRRGCPRYLIRMVADFLSQRTALLCSQLRELLVNVKIGCPQGSLLSPFLWNLLIDDLLRLSLPTGVRIMA